MYLPLLDLVEPSDPAALFSDGGEERERRILLWELVPVGIGFDGEDLILILYLLTRYESTVCLPEG